MKRARPFLARMPVRPHPLRMSLHGNAAQAASAAAGPEELRQFATAWLGGIVFFGTFLA